MTRQDAPTQRSAARTLVRGADHPWNAPDAPTQRSAARTMVRGADHPWIALDRELAPLQLARALLWRTP